MDRGVLQKPTVILELFPCRRDRDGHPCCRTPSPQYRPDDDGRLVFDHTEVDKGYSGQGLAGRLVGFALDDVRARGKRIVAICSYVDKYVTEHPEYRDLAD